MACSSFGCCHGKPYSTVAWFSPYKQRWVNLCPWVFGCCSNSFLVYVLHNAVNIEIKLLWSMMLGCKLALNINQPWNNFWCHFKIPPMSQSCYLVLPVRHTTTFLWPPVIKYHPINCNQVSIQKGFEIGWKRPLPDNFYFCITSSLRSFFVQPNKNICSLVCVVSGMFSL